MQSPAGCAVPDQSVERSGCEHQHHGWSIQQWEQRADADVHGVLQQQPTPSEASPSGLLPEGHQGMTQIPRNGGGEKADRVGQAEGEPRPEAQQHGCMNDGGDEADGAVAHQSVQGRRQVHRVDNRLSSASIRLQARWS